MIELLYDGDDILPSVIIRDALFSTQVNGRPGTCKFRVRDTDGDMVFVVGKPLLLKVDDENIWRGYISNVQRTYFFKSTTTDPVRQFVIEGVDINILFQKRVVFNVSDPTNALGPLYAPGTADDEVIADLVAEFLDLSSDSLDVTTLIENVGDVNIDQDARPIYPSQTWGDVMRSITALTNAIFYIDPDGNFVHTDVDTPNAPFDLSDQPVDPVLGYRDMEIVVDGTGLNNDSLVWGTGMGGSQVVIAREEDVTSITAHGRWQFGEINGSMYKQGTVDRRAESLVQGSPLSKRGAKNDRLAVTCTVFTDGFRAAQKIDFTSNVFGFNDVIPIRRMEMTFIDPDSIRYRLTLSHEIDMPWSFFDNYPFPTINFPPIVIDIDPPPPFPPTEDGCVCGITDSFDRSGATLGTSDAGYEWTSFGAGGSTDGTRALLVDGSSHFLTEYLAQFWDVTYEFEFLDHDQHVLNLSGSDWEVVIRHRSTSPFLSIEDPDNSSNVLPMSWTTNLVYKIHVLIDEDGGHVNVWDAADPEPAGWMLEQLTSTIADLGDLSLYNTSGISGTGTSDLLIDNLSVSGVDRCTKLQFDDFERTVAGPLDWGDSTPSGYPWNPSGPGGSTLKAVADGYGKIEQGTGQSGGQTGMIMFDDDGSDIYWGREFELTTRLKIEALSAATNAVAQMHTAVSGGGQIGFGFQRISDVWTVVLFNTSGNTTAAFTFAVGNHYRFRYQRDVDNHRVRVWLDGDPEPSTWLLEQGPNSDNTRTSFEILHTRSSSITLDWKVWYDFIEITSPTRPCYLDPDTGDPTMPTNDPPLSGEYCELIVPTDGVNLITAAPFRPGTTRVSINGTLQRRGIDYTEDPTEGLIVLDEEPEEDVSIYVCYYVSQV